MVLCPLAAVGDEGMEMESMWVLLGLIFHELCSSATVTGVDVGDTSSGLYSLETCCAPWRGGIDVGAMFVPLT